MLIGPVCRQMMWLAVLRDGLWRLATRQLENRVESMSP